MIAVAFVFENVLGNDCGPSPDADRVLRQLEQLAIPHAMLAAGADDARRRKAKSVAFTGSVIAADASDRRPSDFHSALSTALALPAQSIYFVATDPRHDIEPAVGAGMQAVWLRNGSAYPDELSPPAFVIRELGDLLDVLREPYTRSLLGLRYILHNVARWRPGRFLPGSEYGLGEPKPSGHPAFEGERLNDAPCEPGQI